MSSHWVVTALRTKIQVEGAIAGHEGARLIERRCLSEEEHDLGATARRELDLRLKGRAGVEAGTHPAGFRHFVPRPIDQQAAAPRRTASATYPWPSWFGPRSATNTWPSQSPRESVVTDGGRAAALQDLAAGGAGDRTRRQPRASGAARGGGRRFLGSALATTTHRCNHPASFAASARAASRRSSNGTTLSLNIW